MRVLFDSRTFVQCWRHVKDSTFPILLSRVVILHATYVVRGAPNREKSHEVAVKDTTR